MTTFRISGTRSCLPSPLSRPMSRRLGLLACMSALWLLTGCAALRSAGSSSAEADVDEATVPVALPKAAVWAGHRWTEQGIPGKRSTQYQVAELDGRPCLHARSEASASMLRRKLTVDPTQLGKVSFSWRVPALIADADLTQRDGEDSPVRVVLAFDGNHDELDLRTRTMFDLGEMLTGERPPYATLMYVWENRRPAESVILNPRTDRIRKIVVESGADHLGRWLNYERDLVADYRRAFGKDPGRLIGVAIMTDSDNTDSRAEAWYGDITLKSAVGQPL